MSEEQKLKAFEEAEKKMPTGKVPDAGDIAESYLYAMKDRNLTGAMISTNGGQLLM